jgi:hypothetical protein
MGRDLANTLQKAPNDCWYALEKIGEAGLYAQADTPSIPLT